jgi:lipopolysaccharide export system protein LptA
VQKLRFFLLLFIYPSILFAQQGTQIELIRSTSLTVDTKTGINYVKNPVFKQDNATLACDSAVFYKDRNFFEAFKNVHINQGDTVNIFSDFLDYDGNKKHAHLSSNVRMVDPTSVLTTNVLDYDMQPKIGTYVNGGKIVNKDVTLTSKNGWYFANSKDAYFRYNVVVVTPQSTIKSDTLRYNTLSHWTYFYGPTNIKGKDDNLYTENGAYNTSNENAYFGKKNLYTQNTKSLKGDSLYYYGKIGYGRAVKNIIFKDSEDKTELRGQLGEYYKADERVVVTQNAWFALGTKDSITVKNKKIPDSLFLGADTLQAQMVLQKTLKLLTKPVVQKDNEVGSEDEAAKALKEKEKAEARKTAKNTANEKQTTSGIKTDTKKLSKKERKLAEKKAEELKKNPLPPPKLTDSTKLITDSLKTDSLKKQLVITTAQKKVETKIDSTKTGQKATVKTKIGQKPIPTGSKPKVASDTSKKDSVVAFNPADTVRTRVIRAYHNVRVYKSNMQAKADSLFYTAADSALRWYKNPILWSEGSQQTGDTIHVFFKNNKIHSFQVLQNGFIVNVETDSTKFNQVKGKLITGFFVNGELKNMIVDGNAESMYYNKKDNGEYDNLSQSVSSRIKFSFENKELASVLTVKGNEGAVYPMDKLPKEVTLTGFIWKPELRPISKADIIKGKPKPKPVVKPKTTSKPATSTKSAATEKKSEDLKNSSKPAINPSLKPDTTTKIVPKRID